ncbi:MAG: glycosyltransferase family 4 protein [Acidobacteria bacterium]|nr:glycosyltransferase family 4 protein [Acidobacteriota bacterium]
MRVLIVNNIPAPYFDPLFAQLGSASGRDLTVCYTSTWNRDAGWVERGMDGNATYSTVILDRRRPWLARLIGSRNAAAIALPAELRRVRPDYVIIYGYTLAPQCTAMLYSIATRTKYALIGDANVYADRAAGWKRWMKTAWLRFVVGRAAAILYIGTANREFWERYGARPEMLFAARYAVDNEHFAREAEREREAAEALRRQWNLEGSTVFLFVGRLVARKNVDLIVRAVRNLGDAAIALIIAGDGEERVRLELLAAGDKRVIFLGPVPQTELPRYYAMADALVLPARDEPWGLVVNEAMASGLAVIAHRRAGAAVDLVDECNGVALETFEVEEMTAALRRLAEDGEALRRMKEASRARIAEWSVEGAARGIEEVLSAARRSAGSTVK